MIRNYEDFCRELLNAGFSMAGGNNEGVFGLINHSWNDTPDDSPIRWHTGNPETDPWEWRIRVLDERTDIAYGKVFFRKAGFITEGWYPYFLAARRGAKSLEEAYVDGEVSHYAKRIYDAVNEHGSLALHEIKSLAGFGKEDKSKFESALTDLQMKLYITMCGRRQKTSRKGEDYGWYSTVFCTAERFFGGEVFRKAAGISADEAVEKITERVYELNPLAVKRKVIKFITG
jgi:hypothetical protein